MTKRVTFLQPHLTLAVGATILLMELCERMARRGWAISVVSVQSDPSITAKARAAGVQFIDVGGPLSSSPGFWLGFPGIYRRIARAVRQTRPDALVSGVFPAIWWGWLYKRFNPATYHVFYCFEPSAFIHNPDWARSVEPFYMRWGLLLFKPLLQGVERLLHRHTDYTVVISEYTRREVLRTYPGIDPARITKIYPGISHDVFFDPHLPRQPRVVIMGTLAKFKNVDWVIRAVGLLRQEPAFEAVTLVIKGKGEEKEALLQLITELGLPEAVTIVDAYFTDEQLRNLLGSSRVMVHAAYNEAFGLAPVEAMACGTPTVVTGSGGTGETVVDGVSGLYFDASKAVPDLARQLKTLLADDAQWQRLSAGAIAHAADFSWEKNADDFCALLEQNHPQPPPSQGWGSA